uniref:Phage tail protein C-terminal domain-containing protein n=1 Tax=Providencia stuartii TaxID=588 RepID=A0AAI9D9A3_PROST|nr:hypothetical protein [Providencia stuartii]
MYNIGTVTTTANSTKLIGVGTKWKENINLVLPMQMIQIQIDNTVHNNSIHSIQSNTELTLNFPLPASQTGAKYVIFTTTMDSISAAANAIVAMNVSNVQFSDIQNRIMTETGVIDVKLPDGTTRKTRTEAERDKLLDGKIDATNGIATNNIAIQQGSQTSPAYLQMIDPSKKRIGLVGFGSADDTFSIVNDRANTRIELNATGASVNKKPIMQVGDYGWGGTDNVIVSNIQESDLLVFLKNRNTVSQIFRNQVTTNVSSAASTVAYFKSADTFMSISANYNGSGVKVVAGNQANSYIHTVYTDRNTTKDSNGNLKAASPIVKVFADHIELNEESEGVEMEHLGVGHYLIKGVVGFNADGAWGINNGFVIPQDHNGKNMILIDYNVKQDGDIELFVFHQQNAEMPERFQNKRIKDFGEDGQPIYFENYEPCDVPESRWIDMRVEMPSNSIYNLKRAEAERLAKEAAEKQAEEEAKKAELEVKEGGDI